MINKEHEIKITKIYLDRVLKNTKNQFDIEAININSGCKTKIKKETESSKSV